MATITCQQCAVTITDAHPDWSRAVRESRCPHCGNEFTSPPNPTVENENGVVRSESCSGTEPRFRNRAAVCFFFAGLASLGITSTPDNPSLAALAVLAVAWVTAVVSLYGGYSTAFVLALITLGGNFLAFILTLRHLPLMGTEPSALAAFSLLLAFRGGAGIALGGVAFFLLLNAESRSERPHD